MGYMDIIPRTMLQFAAGFAVLLVIFLAFQFGTSASKSKLGEVQEQEKKLMEKAGKLIQVSRTKIGISSRKESDYKHTVDLIADIVFIGGKEQIFMPVLTYKGAKVTDVADTVIKLKPGETRTLDMKFFVSSGDPPVIMRKDDTTYEGHVLNRQMLMLKNFSFLVRMKQGEIPFIDVPDLIIIKEPRFGSCTAEVSIQCPYETPMPVKLSLNDEDRKCEEQAKTESCRKSIDACGAGVNLELVELLDSESLLDRLKPGSPKCASRIPRLNISVGEIQQDKFRWKLGEEMILSFWEKPKEKELETCWLNPSQNEKCLDLLIGGQAISIPLDSYATPVTAP